MVLNDAHLMARPARPEEAVVRHTPTRKSYLVLILSTSLRCHTEGFPERSVTATMLTGTFVIW